MRRSMMQMYVKNSAGAVELYQKALMTMSLTQ